MKTRYRLFIFAGLLATGACDDYMDVEPKGQIIPREVGEYDLLLNDLNDHRSFGDELYFSSDDFFPYELEDDENVTPDNPQFKFYRWAGDLYREGSVPGAWQTPYNFIYTYNVIIDGIDDAPVTGNGVAADRQRIKAEARVGRSFEYWLLVNLFARQYNPVSAASDPGVPLVTVPDASGDTPLRSSVQEVYDFIIKEVEESVADLPDKAVNFARPDKTAAYALLARYYLFAGDYEKALLNADRAIARNGQLTDYAALEAEVEGEENNAPIRTEQYMGSYMGAGFPFTVWLSDELQELYDPGDYRLARLLRTPCYITGECVEGRYSNGGSFTASINTSVPEMYLVRAECHARLGAGAKALNDINLLRSKRLPGEVYEDLTGSDFASDRETLAFVLDERRREMLFTGIRLFDLKRLNLEPEFATTVTHTMKGETYILRPEDNNWVFPIPDAVLIFNPDIQQNPRDYP
ncbi:RagB/SusD family nutrient uptake outer membrane protein [Sinomicrobium pectinilyticum]|uniref:RagB/SusD family nutrient uptake outer membrane protein n=1 Tax=Sinomicrobium pectinilyticum TaxID=1084421 RepID=A0A3N0DRP5_SINP1|nr:RagB/SusD family nutrient uptake outer membrane protein [Sinomicrobium pectinilyticum]RNL78023.1 RagB/SusD family nutrient uptake outer membrane protein [Sinomicrobium pectinilyticum]